MLYDGTIESRGASVVPNICPSGPCQVTYVSCAALGSRITSLECAVVDIRRKSSRASVAKCLAIDVVDVQHVTADMVAGALVRETTGSESKGLMLRLTGA